MTTLPSRLLHKLLWAGLTALFLAAVSSPAPAMAAGPGSSGRSDPSSTSGTELQTQYDEVLGEEGRLEAAIDDQSARMIQIGADINSVLAQLTTVDLQLTAAGRRLDSAVEKEQAAERALAEAQRRVRRAIDELHAQAVTAYIGGGTAGPGIELLLRSFDSATESGRATSYAGVLIDHQNDVVGEFHAAKAARASASTAAKRTRAAAQSIRDAIAGSKRGLQVKRVELEHLKVEAARAAELQLQARTSLVAKKIVIEARITSLEKESDGIGLVLIAEQAGQPAYTPGSIQFTSPMPGVRPGSPFGMRFHPILHYMRLHAGIDFGAASGSPIRAAADGMVVIAGERGGYGNATVIDHGDSIATVYAHQSRILVTVGQRVKAGDVIGAVGTTGLSTGPHLHFETRVRGVPVNPASIIEL